MKRRTKKTIGRAAIAALVLCAVWLALPPMLANTPLVIRPLEKYVSRRLNARADVEGVKLSTWRGSPDVEISTIDIYDPDTNQFLAFIDTVKLRLSAWHLLIGRLRTKRVSIARIDIELPTVLLHRYLLARGYLSRPLLPERSRPIRECMSFEDIEVQIRSTDGSWLVEAHGKCQLPFMRDTEFSLVLTHNPKLKATEIQHFHVHGTRTVERLALYNGKARTVLFEFPIDLDIQGSVLSDDIDLSSINIVLDTCKALAQFRRSASNVTFQLTVDNQNLPRVERLFKTRTKNNALNGLDVRVYGRTDAASGKMLTDCSINVEDGIFRDVPFKDSSLSFHLINDRIVSFACGASVWDGSVEMSLLEKNDAGANPDGPGLRGRAGKLLAGHLAARRIDLNACLSRLDAIPARSGGELAFALDFEVDNVGVAEFLSKQLRQFSFARGSGEVCLSNAYVTFFASESWRSSRDIPPLVRRFLNLVANMTGASLSVPMLSRVIKHLELNSPRTVTAKLEIEDGDLSAPIVRAETPVGTLIAEGACGEGDTLEYKMRIQLHEKLLKKYGDHPLLTLFRHGDTIELPLTLTGTFDRPHVELDLTDDERKELEERLTELVTAYIEKKLLKERGESADEEQAKKDALRLKKTVRSLIRRLL